MKNNFLRIFALVVLLFTIALPSYSQEEENETEGFDLVNPDQQISQLAANLGLTTIDGQSYFGLRLKPELSIGKLSFGIDVPLLFSKDGFRTDEYTGGVGILRLIRYVSWGVKKRDPFYIKIGDISGSYLGYGMLVNNYTNASSFEKRKVGVSFDILIKKRFGIEGIYSDFNSQSFNMLALRPYIRPFGATDIPVIKTLEIGASYVTDKDNTRMKITDSISVGNQFIKSGVNGYGADLGVHFINRKMIRLSGYMQFAGLAKNKSSLLSDSLGRVAAAETNAEKKALLEGYKEGTGYSVGLDLRVKVLGEVLTLQARCERLWYSNYFVPQFFDAVYEMSKDAKVFGLATTKEKKGIYGVISGNLIEKISLSGGLLIPDGVSETNPGLFQLYLDGSRLIPKVSISGTYLKGGITKFNFKEVFDLDQRSLASLRVGYKLKPWLIVGVDYKWTWARNENDVFEATSQFSPYFGFTLPVFGSKTESNTSESEY